MSGPALREAIGGSRGWSKRKAKILSFVKIIKLLSEGHGACLYMLLDGSDPMTKCGLHIHPSKELVNIQGDCSKTLLSIPRSLVNIRGWSWPWIEGALYNCSQSLEERFKSMQSLRCISILKCSQFSWSSYIRNVWFTQQTISISMPIRTKQFISGDGFW